MRWDELTATNIEWHDTLEDLSDMRPVTLLGAQANALKGVVPRDNIRPLVCGWVGRLAYRQAVAAGGQRIGLDGTPQGEVEEAHRLEATVIAL